MSAAMDHDKLPPLLNVDEEFIDRLAIAAGINIHMDTLCRNEGWFEPMRMFAQLVAEECAKLCDEVHIAPRAWNGPGAEKCATAIRERFKAL